MVSPLAAAAITARSVPLEPSSSGLVTVSVLGSPRSSSASKRGRKRGPWHRGPRLDFRFRSHEEKNMVGLLSGGACLSAVPHRPLGSGVSRPLFSPRDVNTLRADGVSSVISYGKMSSLLVE